jgi:hypothetical protein
MKEIKENIISNTNSLIRINPEYSSLVSPLPNPYYEMLKSSIKKY